MVEPEASADPLRRRVSVSMPAVLFYETKTNNVAKTIILVHIYSRQANIYIFSYIYIYIYIYSYIYEIYTVYFTILRIHVRGYVLVYEKVYTSTYLFE